ncbi:MAG TPA: TonB family protein, partial [Pyrinomonadaceae bacterium]|nr:TonB family protein [Pyrinomonadaceae bacterium]
AQQNPPAANTSTEKLTSGADTLTPAQVDSIIRKFTAKETEFRRALNQYAFKRDALIQELGMGGQVVGEYHRVSDFTFDDQGNRFEKINFFPMPTFPGMTQEDLEDLGGVNPFALEAAKLNQYNFTFVGKERIDELDLFVFDVAPKVMPKKTTDRMFVGRVWVDDRDLQIVKSKGKGVPETKTNRFAVVETYREQIDGKFWFPVYAYADDDIVFPNGSDLRIRMRVKYSDYVVGHGKVTITEVGVAPEDTKPQATQSQPGTKQNTPATTQPKSNVDTSVDENAPTDRGILNSQAIDLPKPAYPAEAKKNHVTGQVQVKVVVDETGKVISAEAEFGPEPLRAAAVEAAKRARFKPLVVNEVPLKFFGILTFDFDGQ